MQLSSTISHELRQVLEVITSSDAESTDKVLCSSLKVAVAVVDRGKVIFGSAEVRVARNSLSTVELTKAFLRF